jgi:two-component system cell cycle response regulator DivK
VKRILVVEDNELNREVLTRRLKKAGFESLIAEDGAQAVERAKAELPDLILMDMNLPVLDGFDATRMLKASDLTRAIPVIALTALVMPGDRERCLEAGCDDYDGKPVDFPSLLSKIQALIK